MSDQKFTIRTMTEPELSQIAIEWASGEGWNPGLDDAACFYSADPNGFYVGLLDDEPVACISLVNYEDLFAFLGFYIVKPGYRSKGYGLQIWNHALGNCKAQTIGLDGVVAQQENYQKSGFRLAYNNIRFEGTAREFDKSSLNVLRYPEVSFNEISSYDQTLFPVERQKFLNCWLNQKNGCTFVTASEGRVTGYVHVRKCRSGYKIGPLFADDESLAEQLFYACNNFVPPDSLIYLDAPEVNPSAVRLAENHGMKKVFETARMYKGKFPDTDMRRVFGVTSFELG